MKQNRSPARTKYLILLIGVLVTAISGYAGYAAYPRFNLPPVLGAGLLVLAASAGIASFFSPCSFPLLLTVLARVEGEEKAHPFERAAALSMGATLFLLLTGGIIAVGGAALLEGVVFTSTAGRVIRISAGILLIFLGLSQAGYLKLPFHRVEGIARRLMKREARLRRSSPFIGFFLFGFFYLVAGFG